MSNTSRGCGTDIVWQCWARVWQLAGMFPLLRFDNSLTQCENISQFWGFHLHPLVTLQDYQESCLLGLLEWLSKLKGWVTDLIVYTTRASGNKYTYSINNQFTLYSSARPGDISYNSLLTNCWSRPVKTLLSTRPWWQTSERPATGDRQLIFQLPGVQPSSSVRVWADKWCVMTGTHGAGRRASH